MAIETWIDGLVLFGMFVLRVAVPLAILLLVGGWLEKRLAPPAARESQQRAVGTRILPFPARPNPVSHTPSAAKDEPAKRTHIR